MAAERMHANEVSTDAPLVRRLLAAQLPDWADLPSESLRPGRTTRCVIREVLDT